MNLKTKDNIGLVKRYHERTKHHPNRFARSPGFLDWANEPDPFRRYEGTAILSLPRRSDPDCDYHNLYRRSNNPSQDYTLQNISSFLELSLGLSAWKSYGGAKWALRMNPSSGNLHPTEAYVILGPLQKNDPGGGVYHYSPFLHALEQRAAFDCVLWQDIREYFSTDGFLMGLSSIYWRESWKYGERAFRYCNHDIGHAMAALRLAGNLFGWQVTYLNTLSDIDVSTLLGFQETEWVRFENEYPEALLFVHENQGRKIPFDVPSEIINVFGTLSYAGKPNRLSDDHRHWEVIEEVSEAAEKPKGPISGQRQLDYPFIEDEVLQKRAAEVIRQRRSGLAFDQKTALPVNHFLGMLDKTLPREGAAPFDLGLGEASIDLLVFVHRVSGLESGLYFFIRNGKHTEKLKFKCRHDFLWEKINEASETGGLYLLKRGDFRNEGAKAG